jgi:hypothetical protein
MGSNQVTPRGQPQKRPEVSVVDTLQGSVDMDGDSLTTSSTNGKVSPSSSNNLPLISAEAVNSLEIVSGRYKTQPQASAPRAQSQTASPACEYIPLGEKHDRNLLIPRSQLYPWTIGQGYLEHADWAKRQFAVAKENSNKTMRFDGSRDDLGVACLVAALMTDNGRQMLEHIATMLEVHQYPKRSVCNFRTQEDTMYCINVHYDCNIPGHRHEDAVLPLQKLMVIAMGIITAKEDISLWLVQDCMIYTSCGSDLLECAVPSHMITSG